MGKGLEMKSAQSALVTGASGGLGRALAERLAREGFDLALVGRDKRNLGESARACRSLGSQVRILDQDLAEPGAAGRIVGSLKGLEVDVLVNNAGFTLHGRFSQTDGAKAREMLAVQIEAPVELIRLILPGMITRRRGRILTVGSVYSFSPIPGQALYGAVKAFLWSFTQSLSGELAGTGVTATFLAPGVIRTEFRRKAGIPERGGLPGKDPAEVAEAGVRAMLEGRLLAVPGGLNRAFVLGARLLGHRFLPVIGAINRRRGLDPA